MGLWSWFGWLGPSGFGFSSTAEQVTEGIDGSHLTAIVTGGTSGIGMETARVLALRGVEVIVATRSMKAGLQVKESLLKENPTAKLCVMEMDLSSLSSVSSFVSSFNLSKRPLNILVNNAGIMACPFQLSMDGIEMQFATNHLGHFLLTSLLLGKLKSTAKETGIEGRIVNVSSMAHRYANKCIDFNSINDSSKYVPFIAYGRSKLANILHANELSRRLQDEGSNVTANSLHPGLIPTNISRHWYKKGYDIAFGVMKPFLKDVQQGAATTCYLALHQNLKGVSGKYFADCNETLPSSPARSRDSGKKLQELSEDLINKFHKPT